MLVPSVLQAALLYHSHHPVLPGHPGSLRMSDSMRRYYYWPYMVNDVHQVVKDRTSFEKTKGTKYKHRQHLKLFSANGSLDFISIDLLGPLKKTKNCNQHILVITDRYTQLTRAVPMAKITAKKVSEVFIYSWIVPYGIPQYIIYR